MRQKREKKWRISLGSILEELKKDQRKKFLQYLEKIPQSRKEDPLNEDLPQIIIECYGLERSISAVSKAVKQIPRNDSAIQRLLQPFLGKPKKGKKKKYVVETKTEGELSAGVSQPQSCQPGKENQPQPWRQTIQDLRDNGYQKKKLIAGLVVQKSTLRTYHTKERAKKFFFFLGVADETGVIKVLVYGKERYREIEEGSVRSFRDVILDDRVLKVTKNSKVSKIGSLVIPGELKLEAQMLIYSQRPVCSIAHVQDCPDKTAVSVEGHLKEIGVIEKIKVKTKRRKTDVLDFTLQDDTDSIRIRLWGNDTLQLKGISVGDFVRVINVKSNHYRNTVSLNSTNYTRIFKVQGAAVENVTINVCGISDLSAKETHLDVYLNEEVWTYVVDSLHLAGALGIKVKDLEETVLEKMPFEARAEIHGSKINKIELI